MKLVGPRMQMLRTKFGLPFQRVHGSSVHSVNSTIHNTAGASAKVALVAQVETMNMTATALRGNCRGWSTLIAKERIFNHVLLIWSVTGGTHFKEYLVIIGIQVLAGPVLEKAAINMKFKPSGAGQNNNLRKAKS